MQEDNNLIIHMNTSMANLLAREGIEDFDAIKTRLPRRLVRVLRNGIREISDCYFIEYVSPPEINISKYHDLTDAECTINHIHIEKYTRNQKTGALMRVAIRYMLGIRDILVTQFPGEHFYIVLGYDSGSNSPTVRFYKRRDNEPIWADIEGIEDYADAVMVFEL